MVENKDWKSGIERCFNMFSVFSSCVFMKEGVGKA